MLEAVFGCGSHLSRDGFREDSDVHFRHGARNLAYRVGMGAGRQDFRRRLESTEPRWATGRSADDVKAKVGKMSKLRNAWSKETSADPDNWKETNPAWGQCAISALVIQDLLGGKLLRTKINGTSHYYSELPNGQALDVTREQFAAIESMEPPVIRERDYVLSFPDTAHRYEILKANLESSGD